MHGLIQDHLEEILSGAELTADHPAAQHLTVCEDCRDLVAVMQEHSDLFSAVEIAVPMDPAPGFYARVQEQIEAQRPAPSIWDLFFESMVGRRLATASLAIAMIMGAFLVSTEPMPATSYQGDHVVAATYPMLPASDFPDEVLASPVFGKQASGNQLLARGPGRGEVFLNLVTYQNVR